MKLSDIFKSKKKPQGEPLQAHIFVGDKDYTAGLELRNILAKTDKCPIQVMAVKNVTLGENKIAIVDGVAQVIALYRNGATIGEINLGVK